MNVGGVKVGGSNPVVVQSMTNTDTADSASTVNQIMQLARAGSELVRITVNTEEAAQAVPTIVQTLTAVWRDGADYRRLPLQRTYSSEEVSGCARALDKYRINPGNVNIGRKQDDNFRIMIEAAIEYDKPVRIGVNWGSLDSVLLTQMMDENSKIAEAAGCHGSDPAGNCGECTAQCGERGTTWTWPGQNYPQRQGQQCTRCGFGI